MDIILKIINFSWELLYPCVFVALCTSAALLWTSFNLNNMSGKKRLIPLYIYFAVTAIFVILGLVLRYALSNGAVFKYTEYCFEAFSWVYFLTVYILAKRKAVLPEQREKFRLTVPESALIVITLIAGITMVAILGNSKANYYSGMNTFFNADLTRGVFTAITDALPHNTHPCYRFALFPVFAVAGGISRLFGSGYVMVGAYLVMFIQIALNGFIAVILHRIFKQMELSPVVSYLGAVLYCFTFPAMWLNIFPETYTVTAFLLVLGFYFHLKNNSIKYVFYLLAFGVNPATAVLSGALVLCDIYAVRKKITEFLKKHTALSVIGGVLIIIAGAAVGIYSYSYLLKWLAGSVTAKGAFGYVVIPWMFAPEFLNLSPFFVQLSSASLLLIMAMCIVIIISIFGLIKRRKYQPLWCCFAYLITAVFLHGIFGFGRYNSVIYCALYGWCLLILFVNGTDCFLKKSKQLSAIFLSVFILLCSITNFSWFSEINQMVSNILSTDAVAMERDTAYYINGFNESFSVNDERIVCGSEAFTVIDNVDSTVVYCNSEKIWGLLADGSAFIIYCSDGQPILDLIDQSYIISVNAR